MRSSTIAALAVGGLAAGAVITRLDQPAPQIHDLRDRTVLVTGATSGIGLETTIALARGGARLLLAARDPGRGAAARQQVLGEAPRAEVEVVDLDLASLASVRTCAADVAGRVEQLDVLVNNAGAVFGERRTTEDGFEATFAVNHLGPYLLTRLLLPTLHAAPAARVVTVASTAHRQAALDLDDLMFEDRPYRSMVVYGTSKLANVLFARELAHRVRESGITSNSLHPGTVRSGFGREGHPLLQLGVRIAAPLFVDARRGASTSVFAAADPAMAGVTGQYVSRRRVARPSLPARDDALARQLWDRSADLVGLPHEVVRLDG